MIARTGKPLCFRPRLVLGYADSAHAAQSARYFRRHGWEVHRIGSGTEARRLAHALAPEVVILDTELADESGWLTAVKLRLERPAQIIFLMGPELSPVLERFADFVGAAGFVARSQGAGTLADVIVEALTPAAAVAS